MDLGGGGVAVFVKMTFQHSIEWTKQHDVSVGQHHCTELFL